jgi:hypothetical protein
MILGVDFDNTIVAYDSLFHRVALERGLIPADLPVNKTAVRDHLRATGREDIWTEMQGDVYGARLNEAEPYPGVLAFFRTARERGIPLRIISHKTRHPYRGEKHDLHAAARAWLTQHGFFATDGIGLREDEAFFELSKAEKLARIAACGCTHFIDDLPELLAEPTFPKTAARFLFDSQNLYADTSDIRRVTTWIDLTRELLGKECWLLTAERLAATHALPLWEKPQPLTGGANNRVVRLGDAVLAKRYFHHPADPRDRFATERAFYRYATAAGVTQLPRALGWDEPQRLGLFAFVEGRSPSTASRPHVEAAVAFFTALNRSRALPEAAALPAASEACFSLDQHLATVRRRIDTVSALPHEDALDASAIAFVNDTLIPAWAATESSLRAEFNSAQLARDLSVSERCVSPSDFGFHNSLLTPSGELVFIDFEYAGWDDPAKLVGDFFCQPDIPVSLAHIDWFIASVASALQLTARTAFTARCRALLPLYRIKWTCILLNEFTRAGRDRRVFSLGANAATARRERQLTRARQMLGAVTTTV